MAFLYTLIHKVLSGPGVIKAFKNGIETSGHVSSTVNLMDWSMLFYVSKEVLLVFCLLYYKGIIHIPSP